uniref:Uncharacterized protein n=1 Tax=Anopheles darlingi TaxID=43151 RepID=A0A2M4D197_ANODA
MLLLLLLLLVVLLLFRLLAVVELQLLLLLFLLMLLEELLLIMLRRWRAECRGMNACGGRNDGGGEWRGIRTVDRHPTSPNQQMNCSSTAAQPLLPVVTPLS